VNKALTREKRVYQLFKDMVDIYSPSGKEEEIVSFLVEYLDGTDLNVMLRPVDETRYNIEVSAKYAQPDILFLGHVDTVPAFDIEQYGLQYEDGKCYGLGTADMKSGCAAMIEAFISAAEHEVLSKRVMLSLVVGEEENGDGTEALLSANRFSHALVAEPTNMQPCTRHYGYMEILLNLFGYRRHAAMSDLYTHAARTMLRLLLRLERFIEESKNDAVLNIRDLHSSESGFAVPDSCSSSLDLHLPPGVDVAAYAQQLRTYIDSYLEQSSVNGYEIDMPFVTDGYTVSDDDLIVRTAMDVFSTLHKPWEDAAFRSHSDANLLRDAGCYPLMLGPGSLAAAHTRDEYIELNQLYAASEVYAHMLARLG
jgi:acetylornithine deacetylase